MKSISFQQLEGKRIQQSNAWNGVSVAAYVWIQMNTAFSLPAEYVNYPFTYMRNNVNRYLYLNIKRRIFIVSGLREYTHITHSMQYYIYTYVYVS